jgi:serine/threonine-protein phosphatase CPPED1
MKRISLGICALVLLGVAGTYSVANRPWTVAPEREVKVASEGRNPWTSLKINNDPDEFQFAVISDRTGGHRANIFAQAVERLNLMQPEFVLSVGDLIEGGRKTPEQIKAEWDDLNGMVNRLQMKFFYAPGNHDVGVEGTDKYWQDKIGRRWYHFIYHNVLFLILNTEDPPNSGGFHLGDEQLAWTEKILAENKNVRWTIVSMHKPLWTRPDVAKTGLLRLEKALADRPYTVFVGHVHRFQKFVRNGRDYYQLATTGGGSKMRGVEEGEFDHFVWVTMKKNGPVLANILLDAVYPENLKQPVTNEKGTSYARIPARQPFEGFVFLDGSPIPGAMVQFHPAGEGATRGVRADGVVQADGSFRLSTVKANDGIPAGEYVVTVTLRRPLFTPEGKPGPNTLPDRYAREATSPLRAKVVEGKNAVTLELHP